MIRLLFHALKIITVGMAAAYLATHYLLKPLSNEAELLSLIVLFLAVLASLFGQRLKRLSQ